MLPKPLMPIGDQAILELVLGQLKSSGISDVTLCVGYLSNLIKAVIGNKTQLGVDITYVVEQEALGTAGPLRLVPALDSTFIAMNGDVLTTLDFDALVRFHKERGNLVTIATCERQLKIDYGVLHLGMNGHSSRVIAYVEKPEMRSVVSMGIYVLEPEAISYIPESGYFDFPDLVRAPCSTRRSRSARTRTTGCGSTSAVVRTTKRAVAAWLDGNPADAPGDVESYTGGRAVP